MLLRSGHNLKNKKTFMEKMKLRRSMMSENEYEALTSSSRKSQTLNKTNTGTDVRSRIRRSLNTTNKYSSYMGGSASNSRGTTMELNSRGTAMELNSRGGRGQELNSRGGGRGHTNHSTDITTTTRKTLIEEFENEDSLEKGMKETQSTKKKKKKAAVINHMYGRFVQ